MAAATVAPRFVFGFRPDVADNVAYTDEGAIVYAAGHNVVIYSSDTRQQKLIPGALESEGITALCVSANKKLLAVAERSEKAMVTVYDLQTLKRRKVLVAADSKEYTSLAFSADGKMLLAQGGAPEWNLVLWVWEKSKVAASIKTTNQQSSPLHNCAMSTGEGSLVSVVGHNIFKVFKYSDGAMKALNPALGKRDPGSITCQLWVLGDVSDPKERLLLGTMDGEVLMLENGTDARAVFNCDNGLAVHSLAAYSKGFVAGQEGGVVTIFEKDDKELYRRARAFSIESNPVKVRYMAISPNEEHLVCSLENGQAYTLLLSNSEIMKADEMNFDVMGTSNHQGPVTGMDICVRKPLLVTCSTDKSIRFWNYVDRTCELTKWFPDEIFSVAIHPTGLQVLVGFADKLRLMTVLMEDLKTMKELGIKGCRECCFSTGGHYFAAVNGTTVSIYNTYTCENVGNLRGHNGKVRSLCWSPDDTRLISAGMDGAVYEWRLKDFKRDKENVLKGCNYSSVLATPDCKTLYATGSDRKIKEFEEAPGAGTQITREIDAGVNLTQLTLLPGAKVMMAATEAGGLRTYKYPLTGEFTEIKVHQGAITRMRMSWDEQLLATASDDGSISVYDVRERDAKAAARREQERLDWAAEVLVTRSELDEKKTRTAELEQQVAELTMQTEYQLRLKDLHLQERVKELTEKFSAELEADRQKFELLLTEKNEQEMEYEEKLKAAEERSQAQLAALDTSYQAKIMAEVERFQSLAAEKEALAERWDEQNALLVESHERVIGELTEDYEAKLAEEALRIEQLQAEKAELEREFEEIKRQLEEDADREIEEMKEKYESKLQGEREASLRLKGENGIMRKKFNALQKDIEAQKEEIKNLFEQKRELYATIASLEKDIASLKREIRERDETIGDKERRIYDLKKKNQELEKFKFVLDYKIKELKKQIEPREEEIAEMKGQIKEMDGELERYHKTNSGLDLLISNLRLKQNGLSAEVLTQRRGKADAQGGLRRIQHDLQTLVAVIQEPKALKERVKGLYQKYCADLTEDGMEESGDLEREAARQREYLEKTVDSLKRKLAKDSELHRTDNLRIMQENTALIKEINELRREIRSLRGRAGGTGPTMPGLAGASMVPGASGAAGGRLGGPVAGPHAHDMTEGLRKELDMQRELISRMRDDANAKQARIRQLEAMAAPRPMTAARATSPP
ncbi:WD repeat domain 65-like protein [Haematococcus lacustris]